MGMPRRLFMIATVLVQLVTFGWVLLVLGSAGILGDVALLAASDALVAIILTAIAAVLTIIQIIILLRDGREWRQLQHDLDWLRSDERRLMDPNRP
ncbi:MAG TPA: hypothetical protein VGT61_16455 [Thermomicrobiales bacterium]|jgi:hypothetical protein|nr:hypothetical protein [Thermomicrobiales bacterium]